MDFDGFFTVLEDDARQLERKGTGDENRDEKVPTEERSVHSDSVAANPSPDKSKGMKDKPTPPLILKIKKVSNGDYVIKRVPPGEEVVNSGSSRTPRTEFPPKKRSSPKIPSKKHKNNSSQNSSQNRVSLTQETVSVIETTEDSKRPKIDESSPNWDPYNFFEDEELNSLPVSYAQRRKKKVSSQETYVKSGNGSYGNGTYVKSAKGTYVKSGNERNVTNSSDEFKKPFVPSRKLVHSSVPPQLQKVDSKSRKITNELCPKLINSSCDLKKANDSPQKSNESQLRGIEKEGNVIESIGRNYKPLTKRTEGSSKGKIRVSSEELPKSILSSPKKVQKVEDKDGKDTKDLDLEPTNSTGDLKKANKTKKKSRRWKGTKKRKAKRPPTVKKSAPSNVEKSDDNNSGKESDKEKSIVWPKFPRSDRRKHVEKCQKPKVKPTEVPRCRKMRIVPRVPVSHNIPLEADHSVYGTCLPSLNATEELLSAHAQAHNTLNTLPGNVAKNVQDKAELFIKNILLTIKEQRSMRPELTGTPINMDDLALALKNHMVPFPSRPLSESLLRT